MSHGLIEIECPPFALERQQSQPVQPPAFDRQTSHTSPNKFETVSQDNSQKA